MRTIILCESLALVFIVLSYIFKCIEYKDLRNLFDNRAKSIKMLNNDLEKLKKRFDIAIKINARLDEENDNLLRTSQIRFAEIIRLKHRVYALKKDIKRKDRAIVRYKTQNKVFKHGYHESEKRCEDLRDRILTEENVCNWYKTWYNIKRNENDAYLYCLRQIQEEVENAKKE